jgi:hypothetical protein
MSPNGRLRPAIVSSGRNFPLLRASLQLAPALSRKNFRSELTLAGLSLQVQDRDHGSHRSNHSTGEQIQSLDWRLPPIQSLDWRPQSYAEQTAPHLSLVQLAPGGPVYLSSGCLPLCVPAHLQPPAQIDHQRHAGDRQRRLRHVRRQDHLWSQSLPANTGEQGLPAVTARRPSTGVHLQRHHLDGAAHLPCAEEAGSSAAIERSPSSMSTEECRTARRKQPSSVRSSCACATWPLHVT